MFDTFDGLPLHALVLHATVVLVPLMCLATVAVAVVPRWRGRPAVVVSVIDAALIGLVWVTIESGEVLQGRLAAIQDGVPAEDHGERGALMIYAAVALFAVSVIVALLARRGGFLAGVSVLLAVVVGVGVTGWTAIVGDSGARVVWEDVIQNTPAP